MTEVKQGLAAPLCSALRNPFQGIIEDVRGRFCFYKDDWQEGLNCGFRVLAPSTYIFFASAIPALAFGQQISTATDGVLTVVQILAATAMTGVLQAVIGGQPLLIVGVSEPITLIYGYCYSFARDRAGLGRQNFLAWMAWVCVWAALMLLGLGIFNACRCTDRFTRLAGELFGMLIAVLFMQEAIKGTLGEFRVDKTPFSISSGAAGGFQWRLSNGLFALFIGFATLLSALQLRQARAWRFLTGPSRSFLADYGVTLSVVAWSGASYALQGAPQGVPRRLALPNTWQATASWSVVQEMGDIPGSYVAAALVPALLIAILFYFDHTVSAQLAQLEEFNLVKPPAYHYDLFLLGFMTLACGLLGLPPVNGVLPQAPLHTKCLITLKQQNAAKAFQRASRQLRGSQSELAKEVVEQCRQGGARKAADFLCRSPDFLEGAGAQVPGKREAADWFEQQIVSLLPVDAQEQRVSNLIQSLLVAACLGITPGLKKMPTSVLWGYFAYLSVASLPGSQFWERFLLIWVDPSRRPPRYPGAAEVPWHGRVKWRKMVAFTIFQAVYCGLVYGITWIPIAGVVFPVPILLLIPLREYVLPRFFGRADLAALDPAGYEDENGQPRRKEQIAASQILQNT